MASYGIFADYYDALTANVDYARRADFLLTLFQRLDRRPTLLLDLACGTGGFSFPLDAAGIDVIGVDPSEDMLAQAQEKKYAAGNDRILFLQQRAQELDLFGTVDGAICCLDSVNHFGGLPEVVAAFQKVSLFLEPGRLFIFDVNTLYKHRQVLADHCFCYELEHLFLVWQNSLLENRDVQVDLDFFLEVEDGLYDRCSETFTEYGFTMEELESALTAAGFSLVAAYDDMQDAPVTEKSQRVTLVARKDA